MVALAVILTRAGQVRAGKPILFYIITFKGVTTYEQIQREGS